ncbi:MAG: hypothetical protein ACD_22C00166G0006 [uncultured bacterium]|nr:MAG: hypothetical protein ACD_22C00166G0006 [uncultured bacterium]
MGRYYFSKKQEADNLKKIEISQLKRRGFLNIWRDEVITWVVNGVDTGSVRIQVSTHTEGNKYVTFLYNSTSPGKEKVSYCYIHSLTTSRCNFGGTRYWFICRFCGRRVGILYMGDTYFRCRHCLNLTYNSRNENRRDAFYPIVVDRKQHKRADNIRIKYYKGKPTKRYQRLLNKGGFLDAKAMLTVLSKMPTVKHDL